MKTLQTYLAETAGDLNKIKIAFRGEDETGMKVFDVKTANGSAYVTAATPQQSIAHARKMLAFLDDHAELDKVTTYNLGSIESSLKDNPVVTSWSGVSNEIRAELGLHRMADVLNIMDVKTLAPNIYDAYLAYRAELSQEMLDVQVESIKRRRRRDVFGDELNEDRRAACLPEEWDSFTRQKTASPVLTVVVDYGANSIINAASLVWLGAAVTALVDLLEDGGYRVNLYATSTAKNAIQSSSKMQTSFITLKAADDPLDVDAILMTVCFAGYFRTCTFVEPVTPLMAIGSPIDAPKPMQVAHNLGSKVSALQNFAVAALAVGVALDEPVILFDADHSGGGMDKARALRIVKTALAEFKS